MSWVALGVPWPATPATSPTCRRARRRSSLSVGTAVRDASSAYGTPKLRCLGVP